MSSRSHHRSSGDVSAHKKSAERRSNTCTRTSSYCDSQYSEKQRNQRKTADRSPASRGYPDECVGNDNHLFFCKNSYVIINNLLIKLLLINYYY